MSVAQAPTEPASKVETQDEPAPTVAPRQVRTAEEAFVVDWQTDPQDEPAVIDLR